MTAIPALQRGLSLLELLAGAELPLSFGQIVEELSAPRASTARLLSSLQHTGHVRKSVAGYQLGERAKLLSPRSALRSRLTAAAPAALQAVSEATHNTCLLVYFGDSGAECLAKHEQEASVSMQPVGRLTPDISLSPWGALFYHSLEPTERARWRARMARPRRFEALLPKLLSRLDDWGVAYDDQWLVAHLRRLAAPISQNGHVVACLGLGGNPLTLPDQALSQAAQQLRTRAEVLERQLAK